MRFFFFLVVETTIIIVVVVMVMMAMIVVVVIGMTILVKLSYFFWGIDNKKTVARDDCTSNPSRITVKVRVTSSKVVQWLKQSIRWPPGKHHSLISIKNLQQEL